MSDTKHDIRVGDTVEYASLGGGRVQLRGVVTRLEEHPEGDRVWSCWGRDYGGDTWAEAHLCSVIERAQVRAQAQTGSASERIAIALERIADRLDALSSNDGTSLDVRADIYGEVVALAKGRYE